MNWWTRYFDRDPLDGPPPEVYEVDVPAPEPTRPQLTTVKDIDGWMTAAEERELLIWKEIDDLLLELKGQWPWRTRGIRRELKWLRKEAKQRGYRWGA